MSYVFTDFIGKIAPLDHPEALRGAMSQFVEGLGFESFMFLHSDDRTGDACVVSNYPGEWLERYTQRDYAHVDPVVRRCSRSKSSFVWGTSDYLARLHGKQKELFDEAGEFGVKRGMCVVWKNGPGNLTGISVATSRSEAEFNRLIQKNRADLELIGLYFCSHVDRNLGNRSACWQDELLTPEEKDCLYWSIQGRQPGDVAEIMQESEGTVITRLQAAMRKLRACDVPHASAMALDFGLIKNF